MISNEAEPALSPLGLGCARIGSFNNPQSMSAARALIERALALGVTTIDTSNIYGQGDSERQIGRALAGRRDDAFVVTKAGRLFSTKMRLLRPLKPLLRPLLAARSPTGASAVTARREEAMRCEWRPAALTVSLEGSLRRLRTDRVDGFLLHSPPPDVAGDPQVAAALSALKAAGKLRHFGVSCDELATLTAALTMDGLTLLQLPWDLIAALPEGVAAAIRASGALVLAREVIRGQPERTPGDAVCHAAAHPLVASTLVGTTSAVHLRAMVAARG